MALEVAEEGVAATVEGGDAAAVAAAVEDGDAPLDGHLFAVGDEESCGGAVGADGEGGVELAGADAHGGGVGFACEAEEDLAPGLDGEGDVGGVLHGVVLAGAGGEGGGDQEEGKEREACFSLHVVFVF